MENYKDLSIDDFKSSIDDIMKDLESNPEKINDMTNDQVLEVEKKLNPYGSVIYGPEKYTCLSFTNLREKYLTRLLMTSLIGFTYQMMDEYKIEDDDINIKLNKENYYDYKEHPDKDNKQLLDNFYNQHYYKLKTEILQKKEIEVNKENLDKQLSEDEEMELNINAKKLLDEQFKPVKYFNNEKYVQEKERTIQEQSESEKKIIKKFLDKYFNFDPKLHTKSAYVENDDPERKNNPNNQFTEHIPPKDTYGRFQYYYDVNYEELRTAVMYLYCEKPDIEAAINVFESFDTVDECNEYIKKHQDNVICNLLNLTNGKWNLLGSFKQNRERINFYNKNTRVIENILNQIEDDSKIGKELLNDRIKKKKTKNIEEYGKDHPNFLRYKKENPIDIDPTITNVTYDEENEKVIVEKEVEIAETGAEIDEDGVPKDSIEVGITSINLKNNKINTGKIYTKAKAPEKL